MRNLKPVMKEGHIYKEYLIISNDYIYQMFNNGRCVY